MIYRVPQPDERGRFLCPSHNSAWCSATKNGFKSVGSLQHHWRTFHLAHQGPLSTSTENKNGGSSQKRKQANEEEGPSPKQQKSSGKDMMESPDFANVEMAAAPLKVNPAAHLVDDRVLKQILEDVYQTESGEYDVYGVISKLFNITRKAAKDKYLDNKKKFPVAGHSRHGKFLEFRRLPHTSNRETPVAVFVDLINLISGLPGAPADFLRRGNAEMRARGWAGDLDLAETLMNRADQHYPELAPSLMSGLNTTPAALEAQQKAIEEKQATHKLETEEIRKAREQAEIRKIQLEAQLYEKDMAAKMKEVDVKMANSEHELTKNRMKTVELADEYVKKWDVDYRVVCAIKDYRATMLMNMTRPHDQLLLTMEDDPEKKWLPDFSTLAKADVGIPTKLVDNNVLRSIGMHMSILYKRKYGNGDFEVNVKGKAQRLCNGADRAVNLYTERDRSMAMEAISKAVAAISMSKQEASAVNKGLRNVGAPETARAVANEQGGKKAEISQYMFAKAGASSA